MTLHDACFGNLPDFPVLVTSLIRTHLVQLYPQPRKKSISIDHNLRRLIELFVMPFAMMSSKCTRVSAVGVLQMDPNYRGSWGCTLYRGSRVHPNHQGSSWVHPNNRVSKICHRCVCRRKRDAAAALLHLQGPYEFI